ncbi:MAG: hypothetical protein FJ191_07625 [Gammaproteobacteria bacterium]|nr:hypothetical protein [Gammaproteobacteria bacterium]
MSPEPATLTTARALDPAGGLRLLLDPYLCFGPGSEPLAPTLCALARRCAALGLRLAVENRAWEEAGSDPDVRRRGVALWRFEPLERLPDLPLPSVRDLATRFIPARSELDQTDLRLLGALHTRVAGLLIAEDGRLHRLADRAGFGERVLTPFDGLAWLDALAGQPRELRVTEITPAAGLADPVLGQMLAEDCEPFDPYLAARLDTPGSRLLVATDGDERVALGLLCAESKDLVLAALATAATARGRHAIEPIVAAALATARRLRITLRAPVPPHQDQQLMLLGELGFERQGRDRHGREILCHAVDDGQFRLAAAQQAWLLPLDAATHDRLMPELAGATQPELFGPGPLPHTLGSPMRKQMLRSAAAREPAAGDALLLFHLPSPDRIRSASLTAAARVQRVRQVAALPELLALTAGRDVAAVTELRGLLQAGPVSVFDLQWLGRLAQPLALAALLERGLVSATPRTVQRIEPAAWRRLAPALALA